MKSSFTHTLNSYSLASVKRPHYNSLKTSLVRPTSHFANLDAISFQDHEHLTLAFSARQGHKRTTSIPTNECGGVTTKRNTINGQVGIDQYALWSDRGNITGKKHH
jgi:hypothetical protein